MRFVSAMSIPPPAAVAKPFRAVEAVDPFNPVSAPPNRNWVYGTKRDFRQLKRGPSRYVKVLLLPPGSALAFAYPPKSATRPTALLRLYFKIRTRLLARGRRLGGTDVDLRVIQADFCNRGWSAFLCSGDPGYNTNSQQ
jgi:hypothetical protein